MLNNVEGKKIVLVVAAVDAFVPHQLLGTHKKSDFLVLPSESIVDLLPFAPAKHSTN